MQTPSYNGTRTVSKHNPKNFQYICHVERKSILNYQFNFVHMTNFTFYVQLRAYLNLLINLYLFLEI